MTGLDLIEFLAVLFFCVLAELYLGKILGNRLYQELYSKRKSSIIKEFGSLKHLVPRPGSEGLKE